MRYVLTGKEMREASYIHTHTHTQNGDYKKQLINVKDEIIRLIQEAAQRKELEREKQEKEALEDLPPLVDQE